MKILSPSQIRAADTYTIEHEPITSIQLMERAADACVEWLAKFSRKRPFMVFVGPGNNGGDGLAIARMLAQTGCVVSIYILTTPDHLSQDSTVNYFRLKDIGITPVKLVSDFLPEIPADAIIIDALFGVGLSRPLEGLACEIVQHINQSNAIVISIDVPSGLFCESNDSNTPDTIIRAHHTLTFQQPKLSFFFADNNEYVGDWHVLDIGLLPEALDLTESRICALTAANITIKPRKKFSHKGNFGHACVIAGSLGMTGAAILAAQACLRTGVGLVTAHIPNTCLDILQISTPEAIVSLDTHPDVISQIPDIRKYSAVAIGPGIGKLTETKHALYSLLQKITIPLVVDADALNIIADNGWLRQLPAGTILTPHPKEFDCLAGNSDNSYQRYLKQLEISRKYGIFIILKGAHTSITTPDGYTFFNTTGNPGMATGGSGDVLTGIIVSLLAQGYTSCEAACFGVWIHGAAGDAAVEKMGQHAMIAGDIIRNIGEVIKDFE